MGNEVLVIVGLLLVAAIVSWLILRRIAPAPINSDNNETTMPTLHEQRQFEDDMMQNDGMGLHHRYPHH